MRSTWRVRLPLASYGSGISDHNPERKCALRADCMLYEPIEEVNLNHQMKSVVVCSSQWIAQPGAERLLYSWLRGCKLPGERDKQYLTTPHLPITYKFRKKKCVLNSRNVRDSDLKVTTD